MDENFIKEIIIIIIIKLIQMSKYNKNKQIIQLNQNN
jgi:hypothetical protein